MVFRSSQTFFLWFVLILSFFIQFNFGPDVQFRIMTSTEVNCNPTLSSDDFGTSTKINGVEGAFSVISTDNNGGVYITYQNHWNENVDEEERHIYFAYSHDYGNTWCNSYRVNDNESRSVQCDSSTIAVDPNNGYIYIAWKDNRSGEAKVYIDKSTDRGVSFGPDILVADCPNDYFPPWLPATVDIQIHSDSTIFISWIAYTYNTDTIECNIYFSYSIDQGLSFYTPIIIGQVESGAIFTHPSIASLNNLTYVVYSKRNSTSSNVYIVKSENRIAFSTQIRVNDVANPRYTGGARIYLSQNGTIHIVWTDNRAGAGTQYLDIYYAKSWNEGLTFTSNIRVNNDKKISPPSGHPHFTQGAQGTPSIVVDNNSIVHIFWEDFRNFVSDTSYCRDIYYASSNANPEYSNNFKVNYIWPDVASVNCADPSVAIDSQNNFYLVYSDAPSGDNDHHEIYFMTFRIIPKSSSSIYGFQLFPLFFVCMITIIIIRKREIAAFK